MRQRKLNSRLIWRGCLTLFVRSDLSDIDRRYYSKENVRRQIVDKKRENKRGGISSTQIELPTIVNSIF